MRATKQAAPAVISEHDLQQLDQLSRILAPTGPDVSAALQFSMTMQRLRALMDQDNIKQAIMGLRGFGYRTDKDWDRDRKQPGKGYAYDITRDCIIAGLTKGAALINVEICIINARCYLGKAFFWRRLDEILGLGNWYFVHDDFRDCPGGTEVSSKIRWQPEDAQTWNEKAFVCHVKSDPYSSLDQIKGKADKRCGAWLLPIVAGGGYFPQEPDDDHTTKIHPTFMAEVARGLASERPAKPEPDFTVADLRIALCDADIKEEKAVAYLQTNTVHDKPMLTGDSLDDLTPQVLDVLADRLDSFLVNLEREE